MPGVKLAILGGVPTSRGPWPSWPRAEDTTEKAVIEVLNSGHWSVSGPPTKEKPRESIFAESFAQFHCVPYCVPTSSGSAALTVALESLGVGAGMEVLVPALTWVACGSAVARVGAVPVLVDVDPQTLCMSLEAARAALTPATAAIMLVHLYCTIADLRRFTELARTSGVPLLEDCSHAHGATWKGKRVGTFGSVGVFSMQQSKVLTCGEGGAVITASQELFDRLQQFRADGRRYVESHPDGGHGLENVGDFQGHNYVLSEFQAAILADRLKRLDEENALRLDNAAHLTNLILTQTPFRPLHDPSTDGQPTFYRYVIRCAPELLRAVPVDLVAKALEGELSLAVQPIYDPLCNNVLLDPRRSPQCPKSPSAQELYNPRRFAAPNAVAARAECVAIPHNALLGGKDRMRAILDALMKVIDNQAELSRVAMTTEGHGT